MEETTTLPTGRVFISLKLELIFDYDSDKRLRRVDRQFATHT